MNDKSNNVSLTLYIVAFLFLITGLVIGYVSSTILHVKPSTKIAAVPNGERTLTLPSDATKIQECTDHHGEVYVKPDNLPKGPFYLVYHNKVIGLEYMLAVDEFTSGKAFKGLNALEATVDHINVGFISNTNQDEAECVFCNETHPFISFVGLVCITRLSY